MAELFRRARAKHPDLPGGIQKSVSLESNPETKPPPKSKRTQAYLLFKQSGVTMVNIATELDISQEEVEKYWKEYIKMIGANTILAFYSKFRVEDFSKLGDLYFAVNSGNFPIRELHANLKKVPWSLNAHQISAQLDESIKSKKKEIQTLDIDVSIKSSQKDKVVEGLDELRKQLSDRMNALDNLEATIRMREKHVKTLEFIMNRSLF